MITGERWKPEEIAFLRKNLGKMSYSEIAKVLGRTRDAVRVKAGKLGLQKRSTITVKESICLDCVNARVGICGWVDRREKVWSHAMVKETKEGRMYIVESCKNFIPDLREEALRE